MAWKSMRAGEEKAEALLNAGEPDGRNNGKTDVDDAGGAHAFLQSMEEAKYGQMTKLKSLKERLAETEAESAKRKAKLKKSPR